MSLELYTPCFPLSQSIEMFWHWADYAPPHKKERILPSGLMELTINLSGHTFLVDAVNHQTHYEYEAMIVGLQSSYFVIDTSQPTTILSILFKPGGAFRFFGISANELHNQIISLQDIWGTQADSLYQQLLETELVAERFKILECALLSRLNEQYEHHYAVQTALNLLTTTAQAYTIKQIQQEVALSPPRFIQVFRDDIGVTPKIFTRLQRFNRALSMMANRLDLSWTDIALICGYYDQSHLINEFQSFAGITPSSYNPQDKNHNINLPYDCDS